jgi:hypothetical protein
MAPHATKNACREEGAGGGTDFFRESGYRPQSSSVMAAEIRVMFASVLLVKKRKSLPF